MNFIVRSLPVNCTCFDLINLFKPYCFATNPKINGSIGYVTVVNKDHAQRAKNALRNAKIRGRPVYVEMEISDVLDKIYDDKRAGSRDKQFKIWDDESLKPPDFDREYRDNPSMRNQDNWANQSMQDFRRKDEWPIPNEPKDFDNKDVWGDQNKTGTFRKEDSWSNMNDNSEFRKKDNWSNQDEIPDYRKKEDWPIQNEDCNYRNNDMWSNHMDSQEYNGNNNNDVWPNKSVMPPNEPIMNNSNSNKNIPLPPFPSNNEEVSVDSFVYVDPHGYSRDPTMRPAPEYYYRIKMTTKRVY